MCKDVGGPSPVGPWSLPRPASVGLRLRVDDARVLGLLGPLHHLDLAGSEVETVSGSHPPPAPSRQDPRLTSSRRRCSFSLFSSSQMSVSFLLRAKAEVRRWAGEG